MIENRPSMQVREKAQAIVDADGVEEIPGTQYRVTSGENTYTVLANLSHPSCTCQATAYCSHREAARIAMSQGAVRRAA